MTGTDTVALARARRVLWRSCLTKVLVRPPGAPTVALEGAAAEVWGLLKAPLTVAEIAAGLAAHHQTTAEDVHERLGELIADLLALGVIEAPVPAPASDPSAPR